MTYNEIVDKVAQTVDNHRILQDFGYGAITDIKTVDEGPEVNYPYAFLNPTQSTRTGQTVTYRFNLIVMDVVQEDPTNRFNNYLKVQSECQQYIDDILAALRFGTPRTGFDLTLNVNLTPFKERFQDTVAGMTATLEVEVPQALDNCIAPNRFGLINTTIADGTYEPDPFGLELTLQPPTWDPEGLYHRSSEPGYPYTAVYVEPRELAVTIEGFVDVSPGTGTQVPPVPEIQATEIIDGQPQSPDRYFAWRSTWPTEVPAGPVTFKAEYKFTTQQPLEAILVVLQGQDPADEYAAILRNIRVNIYEL